MKMKNCSCCGEQPLIQSDELGITYRLICENCYKYTQDVTSRSSTLEDPHIDEEALSRLIELWNNMN